MSLAETLIALAQEIEQTDDEERPAEWTPEFAAGLRYAAEAMELGEVE